MPATSTISTTYEYLLNKYGPRLTWEQASEITGIYWSTIRTMCQRGEIKTPRAGYKYILTTKAIADFLDQGSARSEEDDQKCNKPLRLKNRYKNIV